MPNFDALDTPRLIVESNSIRAGIMSDVEPHLLPPDAAAYLLNVVTTVDGRRQKRAGVQPSGVAATGNANGLFALESPLDDLHVLVAQYGSDLWSTAGNNAFARRATSISLYDTFYSGVVGRGATNTASLFLTSCVPYSANASLPFGNLVCLDKGFSFTEVAGNASLPAVRARSAAWFQSRLWVFNSCATTAGPDYLLWSNPLDGRNFSNGQNVQIDPDTGDAGVAVVPLRSSTPQLLLFKERSIHLLDIYWATDGYYTTVANSLDFTKANLRPVTLETGAVATRACLYAPAGNGADILFLSREGVRSMSRSLTDAQGGAGLPLSRRIQPIIDRINWDAANLATAVFWDNIAYFAVPIDGAVRNNFILAYDTRKGGEEPGSWYFLDWGVAAWAPAQLTADRKLFFFGNSAVTETYSSGATNGSHLYQTEVGTSDPGASPIDFDEQTRAFTFDTEDPIGSGLKYRKRWQWLDLALQASTTDVTLAISYKVDDDDDWTLLTNLSVDVADAFPSLPVQLPFNFVSNRIRHNKLALDFVREGYRIQIRIRDNVSFGRIKILQLAAAALPSNVTFD